MRLFWKRIANLPIILVFYSIASIGTAFATGSGQENDRGIFLSLYKEKYQNAFYMLIPKGWKAEGGIIPSGVSWNVVDLVENNIRFRVVKQFSAKVIETPVFWPLFKGGGGRFVTFPV